MVTSAVLCLCLAAAAQETVVVLPEVSITEETKTQEIQVEVAKSETIVGIASYYATKFHGKRTASGERFNSKVLTAAHLTLPFGTLLKVTNLRNMKTVIVRVNDRGPHVRGRIVDLSRAAAELIGMRHTGTARVELEILKL